MRNSKVQERQQGKLAGDFRDFKLKQLGLRALGEQCDCYGRYPDGSVNMNVIIPADHQIASVLKNAANFRRQKVQLAFINHLRTVVKEH